MREKSLRLFVFLVTLAFGIGTSSFFVYVWLPIPQVVPAVEGMETLSPAASIPQFVTTFRGCGMGYSQGYKTEDGENLISGVRGFMSEKEARRTFRQAVRNAERIISRTPDYANDPYELGRSGERIVIQNKTNESGERTVSILWYAGDDFFSFIHAPSENLAYELEHFRITSEIEASD